MRSGTMLQTAIWRRSACLLGEDLKIYDKARNADLGLAVEQILTRWVNYKQRKYWGNSYLLGN